MNRKPFYKIRDYVMEPVVTSQLPHLNSNKLAEKKETKGRYQTYFLSLEITLVL